MGKKTSVYLTDQMLEKLAASGRSLPEVIRTGLDMSPATAVPSRADLTAALREVMRESLAIQPQVPVQASPEQRLVGAIFGEDPNGVRDMPKPHAAAEPAAAPVPAEPIVVVPVAVERPKLPTLDRRITSSMNALVTEWTAGLDNEPEGAFAQRVEGQVRLLLESGVVPADIARGLAEWQAGDSSQTPELIPEVVEQVMEAGE
jgi:hypothetical protein